MHIFIFLHITEAFAVVREAARRKLGMRHFDVQVTSVLGYSMKKKSWNKMAERNCQCTCSSHLFMFPYRQIIGGAVLHDGCIAEMKTGEGKTLVSTLAAYLNALSGNGVHGMQILVLQMQIYFSEVAKVKFGILLVALSWYVIFSFRA